MRLLLDTHVLIWLKLGHPLPSRVLTLLAETPDKFASVVSGQEYEIKRAKRGFDFDLPFADLLTNSTIRSLPLTIDVLPTYAGLPPIHRDPFDRMLVAQAISEGLTFVTSDTNIARYPVETLW